MQIERRGSLESPQTPLGFPAEWLLDIFNGGRSDSGIRVSELTAMQTSTVLACVGLVSRAVGSLPLFLNKVEHVQGREKYTKDYGSDLFRLFAKAPNREMTAATFQACIMCHMLLWGGAYVEIERNGRGDVEAIWPLNPARTRAVRSTVPLLIQGKKAARGELLFETFGKIGSRDIVSDDKDEKANERTLLHASNVLSFPGLSIDGRVGIKTIQLCRQVVGLALATQKYAAKFFGNGAVPLGIVSVPEQMEEIAMEELRRSWQDAYGGDESNKTAILGGGMTYTRIGIDAESSQLTEARLFQRQEVASIFQVPGAMIGAGDHVTQKNAEQQGTEFLTFTLCPWLNLMEQEINRKLFLNVRGQIRRVRFDVRSMRYPDAKSRTTLYNGGKNWGYLCTNDIAEMEGHNPIEQSWADDYWMPQGFAKTDDLPASMLGVKGKAAFAAKHPDAAPLPATSTAQPDGVPGMSIPNGGRPEGVAENGRSALMVRADGKGYETAIIVEERSAAIPATLPTDGLFHVVKDALLRFTTRKKPTVQKASDIFAGVAEAVWNSTAADQRADVDFDVYGHHVFARFKDHNGAITDDTAKQELAEALKFVRKK